MRRLSSKEINDILWGAQILGCGGGGEIDWGGKLIERASSEGKEFWLYNEDYNASPHDLKLNYQANGPWDPLLCIIGAVGGGVEEEVKKRTEPLLAAIPYEEKLEKPILKAIRELSSYTGAEPDGFIPTEIGAGNMAVTLYAAAMTGKFVVDGDCCGRAKPMISISTTRIAGLSATPLAAVNALGDVMILKVCRDDVQAEHICRGFAVASGGTCLCARCMARFSQYKHGMIQGSFSRCLRLGEAMRLAKAKKEDPVGAFLKVENSAQILFSGTIISHQRNHSKGFITGWLELVGDRNFSGHKYSIYFKNEFLAGFKDRTKGTKPDYQCPDLIVVLDEDEYRGVSNWDEFKQNPEAKVTVLGIPAHPIWNNEKGREIFSLESVGLGEEL